MNKSVFFDFKLLKFQTLREEGVKKVLLFQNLQNLNLKNV